jgi:hypothetical protein
VVNGITRSCGQVICVGFVDNSGTSSAGVGSSEARVRSGVVARTGKKSASACPSNVLLVV